MNKYQAKNTPVPSIMRLGKITLMDRNIYDYTEKYDDQAEILNEGKFWMGSKTTNTRCNRFTLFGADKSHADDTKEKKK